MKKIKTTSKLSGTAHPDHQVTISNLIFNIRTSLEKRKIETFIVAPETKIISSKLDRTVIPDINIWELSKNYNKPILIIEISKTKTSDIPKIKKCMKQIDSIQEGFAINYKDNFITRIYKDSNNNIKTDNSDYSKVLTLNLKSCL